MLQVVQAVLRWKIIQLNPLHRYQSSQDLVVMTVNVFEHMRIQHWSRMLQQCENDTLRVRRVSHLTDISIQIDSLEDYSIEELTKSFTDQEVIIMLVTDYENCCEKLCERNDEIFRTISNLMSVTNKYLLYTNSTATLDSIVMEQLLNGWLPLWKAGGKSN